MCRRILAGGFPLTVWNRTAAKAQPILSSGAQWAASPAAVAAASDIVITMVTDSQDVLAVVCGPGGVLEGAHKGLILVDMSSIDPAASTDVARRAAAAGVAMLDAPVTGSAPNAEQGTLGAMVGGDAEHLEIVRPVLSTMCNKIIHAGPNGAGSTIKLINQIVFSVVLEVNAEALVLAQKAGVDPRLVMDVLSAGGARTVAMETRGPRILQRDFAPRFSLANQCKDMRNALAMARKLAAPVPSAEGVMAVYETALAQGNGALDGSIIVTVLEAQAGVTVGDAPTKA
jgi:3-hydroxyisobutyrate dehydrogenase-like beta-hydroxyacid dehydrogenase